MVFESLQIRLLQQTLNSEVRGSEDDSSPAIFKVHPGLPMDLNSGDLPDLSRGLGNLD